MPDPLSLKQIKNNLKNNPNNETSQRNQFRQIERIDTFKVLGRTMVSTGCGMKMDEDFPEAVKKAGGLVLRKYSEQYGKFEIAAIVFNDAMLVKNDPEWIAKQDFSFFGADADKIRKRAVEEASDGGIHFFAKKTGIPVLVGKKGKLIFLSGDEIKTGTGTEYTFEKSSVGLDPQTRKEFEDGARALRENDPAALERLKRAGGAHLTTREKSIAATSDFTLLDARTGEEIGIAASNARLGKDLSFTRDNIFVPESVLINRFIQDSQRQDPSISGRAAWEVFYILPKRSDDEGEGRFGMKVYSVCRFGAMTQDAALSYDADIGKQQKPNEQAVVSQTTIFDAISKKSISGKIIPKSLLPAHPQAMLFDGFSFSTENRSEANGRTKASPKDVEDRIERKTEENIMLRKPKRMRTWFNERLIAPKSEPIMKEQMRKIGDKKEKKKEKKTESREKKAEKRKPKPDVRMPPAFGKKNGRGKAGDKREKPPFAHAEKVSRKKAKNRRPPAASSILEKKKERKSNLPELKEKKEKARIKIREEKFEKKKEQKEKQRETRKERKKTAKEAKENPLFKSYVFEALTSRKTRARSSSGRKRQSGP